MGDDDRRWMIGVHAVVEVVGKIIIACTILGALWLTRPIVELVAGQETLVNLNMQMSISLGVNLAIGAVLTFTVRANTRLRRRVADLETRRKRPR